MFKTYPTSPLLISSGAWLKVLGKVYWEDFIFGLGADLGSDWELSPYIKI